MAITLDSDSESVTNTSTLTFSHTVASGARLLVVSFGVRNSDSGGGITSVKYGGVDLTLVTAIKSVLTATNTIGAAIYYMLDPAAGTADVEIIITGANPRIAANASSWFGDFPGDSSVLFDKDKADGGDAFPSLACPSEPGNLVIDAAGVFRSDPTDTITVDGSQTQLANQTIGVGGSGLIGGTSYEMATGSSTSMDWTINGATTNAWTLCVAAFREDQARLLAQLGCGT